MEKEFTYKRGKYQDDTDVIANENTILVKKYWYGGRKFEVREIPFENANKLSTEQLEAIVKESNIIPLYWKE